MPGRQQKQNKRKMNGPAIFVYCVDGERVVVCGNSMLNANIQTCIHIYLYTQLYTCLYAICTHYICMYKWRDFSCVQHRVGQ